MLIAVRPELHPADAAYGKPACSFRIRFKGMGTKPDDLSGSGKTQGA